MKTKQLPEKGRRGTNRRRRSNGTFVEKVDRQEEEEEEKNSVFAPPTTTTNEKLISPSLSLSHSTELRKSLGTWLREISSCSWLTFVPGPAWVLLSKIYKVFFSSLYRERLKGVQIVLSRT